MENGVTDPGIVLSLFPGIGLLDRAFEMHGFCVVRGPDVLWGGDVRRFRPCAGAFWGIVGGPPCQDFSGLRRVRPTGYGKAMLAEFGRIVTEAQPEWWLLENVARVPDVRVPGYCWQRFALDQGWWMRVSRLRHWQFGSRSGVLLDPPRGRLLEGCERGALANDGRTFEEVCRLQGLPLGFDLPPFLEAEKIRAVGNGVPIVMGRVVAEAIRVAYGLGTIGPIAADPAAGDRRRCACGCGRVVKGRFVYHGPACRKRAQRQRERDFVATRGVTRPRHVP